MIIELINSPEFVEGFRVTAQKIKGWNGGQWCRVQGKELKVALKDKSLRSFYVDTYWYYFVNNHEFPHSWKEVKYDYVKFNTEFLAKRKRLKPGYIMRVVSLPHYGYPLISEEDLIKSGLFSERDKPKNQMRWAVSPSLIEFVKPTNPRRERVHP